MVHIGQPYRAQDRKQMVENRSRGQMEDIQIYHGEGNGNPLQYSCLENPMNSGTWQAIVHRIARVRHDLATKPPNNKPLKHKNQNGFYSSTVSTQRSNMTYKTL